MSAYVAGVCAVFRAAEEEAARCFEDGGTAGSEVPFVEIPAEAFMDAWAETWGTHVAMRP